jgi:peroxiredoxin
LRLVKLSRRKLLLILAAGVAALVAVTLGLLLRNGTHRRVEIGMHAPALAGAAVRGGDVSITGLRRHVVLLSFLDLRTDTTENGASRSQIVFLRSMRTQHSRFGLRVILVDTARQDRNELVNDTYDWNLDPAIGVLVDDGRFAHRFGVDRVPTTFLIGPNGVLRKRWVGLAAAAQLDLAIRDLEGRRPGG